jgi:pyruvate dehydrogenase E2 component (dihydrolipoamide acetyltransferase)
MPIPITMPALSPTMTTGHLIVWHKKVNDVVNTGDLLLEIETDKAVMEVEATQSGIVDYLAVPAGTNDVAVGTIIAVLRQKTELEGVAKTWLLEQGLGNAPVTQALSVPASPPQRIEQPASASPQPTSLPINSASVAQAPSAPLNTSTDTSTPNANRGGQKDAVGTHFPVEQAPDHRVVASPLARKWAEIHGISLHHIQGTGPRGRIVKDDVVSALNHGSMPAGLGSATSLDHGAWPVVSEKNRGDGDGGATDQKPQVSLDHAATTQVPLSGMRKTIAQRLTLSKQTVPHFYLTLECRMDALLSVRSAMNGDRKDLSVNDFMVRACAMALHHIPEMRLMWGDDRHSIQHHHVDLAVAVSIPGGLITPIVSHAETKPLRVLSAELKPLIARARDGKLSPNEYQGGLFTLTNLGMMGIDQFNPIINPGHTGILAIGATQSRPVVDAGVVVVGKVMQATIAADHRVIDGSVAAKFLTTFQNLIQNPMLLLS